MPYVAFCVRVNEMKNENIRSNEQDVNLSRCLTLFIFLFRTNVRTFIFCSLAQEWMEHVRYKIMAIGIIDIAWYSRRES